MHVFEPYLEHRFLFFFCFAVNVKGFLLLVCLEKRTPLLPKNRSFGARRLNLYLYPGAIGPLVASTSLRENLQVRAHGDFDVVCPATLAFFFFHVSSVLMESYMHPVRSARLESTCHKVTVSPRKRVSRRTLAVLLAPRPPLPIPRNPNCCSPIHRATRISNATSCTRPTAPTTCFMRCF